MKAQKNSPPRKPNGMLAFHVRLPPMTRRRIEAIAEAEGCFLGMAVAKAVAMYVETKHIQVQNKV